VIVQLPLRPPRFRDGVFEFRCRTCGDWWELSEDFWSPKHGIARCLACWREYQRLHQKDRRLDPGVVIGIRAAQRMKDHANRERNRERNRKWKAANRERVAAYQRAWRLRQKDKAA
jgi:hypothetical protein